MRAAFSFHFNRESMDPWLVRLRGSQSHMFDGIGMERYLNLKVQGLPYLSMV
jgi:hypothetical protein